MSTMKFCFSSSISLSLSLSLLLLVCCLAFPFSSWLAGIASRFHFVAISEGAKC